MTIQWGDTGKTLSGALKIINVTPYVSEQILTSTALPISMSGSPQVSFTINTSIMSPSFTTNVISFKPVYGINISGQNTSGASATVFYQVNKNGTSFKTGNANITNNNYFTLSIFDAVFVNGDKIDIYLWTAASSGVNYFYQNIFCIPSRLDTGAKSLQNLNVTLVLIANSTYFPLTGKVGSSTVNNTIFFPCTSFTNSLGVSVGTTTFPLYSPIATYRMFQSNNGDASPRYDLNQSATAYPYLSSNSLVSSLTYRELLR